MTHKEMSEIFAVMLLAYPNAEVFKGGIAKLGPTINLWVTCLPEIDFWTGQQAVVKLVRECKFPPTIAEFKEKAEKVQAEVRARIDQAWNYLKLDMALGKTPEEAVAGLSEGTDIRRVIEAIPDREEVEETTPKTYKGFLLIRCAQCGDLRGFCVKQPISSYRCAACGGETPLHDLMSAHIRCKCGKSFKYRTNIEEDSITYNCLSCGAPVDLAYNKKARAYQTVR